MVGEISQGAQITLDAFKAQNPPQLLMSRLRLRSGDFGRSLPQDEDLADPSVASFFRTLIRYGEVEEGVENHEVLDKCHRKGWIHAYITGSDYPVFRYSFASPLHSSVVSWALPPSKEFFQTLGAN